MTALWIIGPCIKDESSYLSRSVEGPETYPHFLGGIAYFYVTENTLTGGRSDSGAAWTPERAREAISEQVTGPNCYPVEAWMTPEERRLKGGAGFWVCPGCGKSQLELPSRHDWTNQLPTCEWSREATRWWPDGTIRDEEWEPDREAMQHRDEQVRKILYGHARP